MDLAQPVALGITPVAAPPNMLDMASKAVGIRNALTQNSLMQQQLQNEQQKNVGTSYSALANITAAIKNPQDLGSALDSYISVLPPGPTRNAALSGKNGIMTYMTTAPDGHTLDPNNPADMMAFNQRAQEFSAIAGQNADQQHARFGQPSIVNTGKAAQPISTSLNGQVTPQSGALPLSMSPGESATQVPGGFNKFNQPIVTTKGNFAASQGQPDPGNPLGVSQGNPSASPNGNALVPGAVGNQTTSNALAPNGVPTALPPGYEKMVEGASANYTDEGRKAYEGAVMLKGRLQFMEHDLEGLAQSGGFLNPGTGADTRMQFARAVNTAAQATGVPDDKLPFDPTKVADAEEFAKETKLAGFALQNSMFGAQREAASVIQASISTQPGLNNSVTGARYLLAGWGELAQREIDRRLFETNWLQTHQGNLVGANESFNTAYPPEAYAARAISKVNPPSVKTASDLKQYLPGTYVKRSNGDVVQVPANMSQYTPVTLQQQAQ